VDNSLGQVIKKLTEKKLYNDTLIVIASKHGQTPIDPTKYSTVAPDAVTNATKVDVLFQTVSCPWPRLEMLI
jgi:predicted AlkP superfamily pyrophosphatase or phosphodiesterase